MSDRATSTVFVMVGFLLATVIGTQEIVAQDRLPVGTPDTAANLPAQPLGTNDLLLIAVYGAPELSRSVRVSAEGSIRLPMLVRRIEAKGRMPAELEGDIALALAEEKILVDPVVTVTVGEYASRPISVAGAVKRPLTFQAWGPVTLLEAVTRAEGLSEDAGREILITRSRHSGETRPSEAQRVLIRDLIEGRDAAANLSLEGGEEIRVLPAGRIFVVGNVKKPGAFRAEDASGITVLKALALAEGLAPFSTKVAYIYRRAAEGESAAHGEKDARKASGSARDAAQKDIPAQEVLPREIPVELRKIMDRRAPDVDLDVNDILYIPDNRSGRTTATAFERALSFAAATTSGVLIYGVGR